MFKQVIVAISICLISNVVQAQRVEEQAKAVLNQFHLAAANADQIGYFSLMKEDFVFLGTDARERWTKSEFLSFVTPYFSQGVGWRYTPTLQNVSQVSDDVLFFDELLSHKKYGQCRGSGVLVRHDGQWLLSQYNLSIPVPNDLAGKVVKQIKQFQQEIKAK